LDESIKDIMQPQNTAQESFRASEIAHQNANNGGAVVDAGPAGMKG
jgi:hypothetical protein